MKKAFMIMALAGLTYGAFAQTKPAKTTKTVKTTTPMKTKTDTTKTKTVKKVSKKKM